MASSALPARGLGRLRRRDRLPVTPAVLGSAALHAVALAALVITRDPPAPPAAPVYSVSLVAAPPGPRAIGVVDPEPPAAPRPTPPAPAVETPPPPRAETMPETPPAPAPRAARVPKPPPRATPVPPTATKPATKPAERPARPAATKPDPATPARAGASGSSAPRAGGGPEGGRGTDVANVEVRGLNFPFPAYLNNVVRQVALRFSPPTRNALLQADIAFLIHRDGSVSEVRVVRRSGNFGFDLEARGAIEEAGGAKAFGALPDRFRDDVLPVTFSFDPRIIR